MKRMLAFDALSLVLLYQRTGDEKFERAARRWLRRAQIDYSLRHREVELLRGALGALGTRFDRIALSALVRLRRWPDYMEGHEWKVVTLTGVRAIVGLFAAWGIWLTHARSSSDLERQATAAGNHWRGFTFVNGLDLVGRVVDRRVVTEKAWDRCFGVGGSVTEWVERPRFRLAHSSRGKGSEACPRFAP
jgi:hypothetical protein